MGFPRCAATAQCTIWAPAAAPLVHVVHTTWKANDGIALVPQAISDYALPTATIPLEPRLIPGLPAAGAELGAIGDGGGALGGDVSAAAAAEAGVGGLEWNPLTGNAVEPPSVRAQDSAPVCICVWLSRRNRTVHLESVPGRHVSLVGA